MSEDLPTNSVLAVKLDYIQRDINVIKKDVADIKNDTITRREFEVYVKDSEDKIRNRFTLADSRIDEVLSKTKFTSGVIYGIFGLIGTSFLVGLIRLFINK